MLSATLSLSHTHICTCTQTQHTHTSIRWQIKHFVGRCGNLHLWIFFFLCLPFGAIWCIPKNVRDKFSLTTFSYWSCRFHRPLNVLWVSPCIRSVSSLVRFNQLFDQLPKRSTNAVLQPFSTVANAEIKLQWSFPGVHIYHCSTTYFHIYPFCSSLHLSKCLLADYNLYSNTCPFVITSVIILHFKHVLNNCVEEKSYWIRPATGYSKWVNN